MLTDSGMQIAPSTYYAAIARLPSARAVRDEHLKKDIVRVYEENYSVYGAEKVWWVVTILVSVGLFWAVGVHAMSVGQVRAEKFAAGITNKPNVVAYSEKRLELRCCYVLPYPRHESDHRTVVFDYESARADTGM